MCDGNRAVRPPQCREDFRKRGCGNSGADRTTPNHSPSPPYPPLPRTKHPPPPSPQPPLLLPHPPLHLYHPLLPPLSSPWIALRLVARGLLALRGRPRRPAGPRPFTFCSRSSPMQLPPSLPPAAALGDRRSGLVVERLWFCGLTYLRAAGSLRQFALLELAQAAAQVGADPRAGPLVRAGRCVRGLRPRQPPRRGAPCARHAPSADLRVAAAAGRCWQSAFRSA